MSSLSPTPEETGSKVHTNGGDLTLSLHESISRDDPTKYFYSAQIIEEDKTVTDGIERRESGRVKEMNGRDNDATTKWGGSLMEVQCDCMSYVPTS